MKAKAVVLAAAAVSAAVVFGQGLVPAGKPRVPAKEKPAKELTPEEVEQNRAKAAAFRKAIADRGGWVSVPMAGPALKLVDATAKGWALEGLEAVKANLDRYGLCPVEAVRKGVPANALAEGLEAAKGTCGVVMLVDGAEDAPLMAVYPEERLALIDMTALSKGVKGSGVPRGSGRLCQGKRGAAGPGREADVAGDRAHRRVRGAGRVHMRDEAAREHVGA